MGDKKASPSSGQVAEVDATATIAPSSSAEPPGKVARRAMPSPLLGKPGPALQKFLHSTSLAKEQATDRVDGEGPSGQHDVEELSTPELALPEASEPFQEVFQRAQAILQKWADMELNRPLILSGDLEAVRKDVVIKSLLEILSKNGSAVVDLYWKHLELILDNRKKYYLALAAKQ
jgi:hypothetical protein